MSPSILSTLISTYNNSHYQQFPNGKCFKTLVILGLSLSLYSQQSSTIFIIYDEPVGSVQDQVSFIFPGEVQGSPLKKVVPQRVDKRTFILETPGMQLPLIIISLYAGKCLFIVFACVVLFPSLLIIRKQ